MRWQFVSDDLALIPLITAAIELSVGVEQFPVTAGMRQTDTIVVMSQGRQVEDADDRFVFCTAALIDKDRIFVVMAVDPGKATIFVILLPESREAAVKVDEVTAEMEEFLPSFILFQLVPVEA